MSRTFKPLTLIFKWGLLGVFLAGVFLRWNSLTPTSTMLHHDEAWNGIDALSLLENPRLMVFFPGNFGRESGWVYWMTPYIFLFGANPFSVRLAATMAGILTLAVTCKLGRELFGPAGAFWACATLSIFYWHVHLSHLALRANLYVLVGTLGAIWLLQAYRTNSLHKWILGGGRLGRSFTPTLLLRVG